MMASSLWICRDGLQRLEPLGPGWEPLSSSNTYVSQDRMLLTGDILSKFTELSLFDVPAFDRDGPVVMRAHEEMPGFYVIAVLRSDYLERTSVITLPSSRGSLRSEPSCCPAQ